MSAVDNASPDPVELPVQPTVIEALIPVAVLIALLSFSVYLFEIGRAHVRTPVTSLSRMPSSA